MRRVDRGVVELRQVDPRHHEQQERARRDTAEREREPVGVLRHRVGEARDAEPLIDPDAEPLPGAVPNCRFRVSFHPPLSIVRLFLRRGCYPRVKVP